ncbi:MAG: hypothetical protein LBT31_09905 [Synergistaceae bacterium]|jgi:hypothetical protein|nr:hypothetical protein [Synergistaceae bacterium]
MKLFGKVVLGVLLGVFLWIAPASAAWMRPSYYAYPYQYPYYTASYYAPYAPYACRPLAVPVVYAAPTRVYARPVVYAAPVVYAPAPVAYAPVAYGAVGYYYGW